jgi:predicted nucleic acid-binding protein
VTHSKTIKTTLVDTSYWVDFFRGNAQGLPLVERLGRGDPLSCSEPIQMEMLAGARSAAQYNTIHNATISLHWSGIDPASDFEAAARIYSLARKHGITPGGLLDCLIIAIAVRTNSQLMTRDKTQKDIAQLLGLVIID